MKGKNSKSSSLSRRQFIKSCFALGAGFFGANAAAGATTLFKNKAYPYPDSEINGVQVGVTTYSYRSMPAKSAVGQLNYVVNDGINAVELVGNPVERFAGRPEPKTRDYNKQAYRQRVAEWRATVPMAKFRQIRQIFNDLGVSIYTWKPRNLFGRNNTDAEINYAFRVARALGASACTTEHPRGTYPHDAAIANALTKRFGEIAAKYEILMAYHAHTNATPTFWNTALEQSRWNAINLDVGHWVAAGNPSVLPFIKKHHKRIESLHLKDRTTPAHGRKNLPWGQGDTPLIQILRLMRDQRYTFPASIELEYKIPEVQMQ